MTLRGKNILVTGGAGFIGSHLVDRLVRERPGKIVVVDNFFLGREENLRPAQAAFEGLKIHRLDAGNLPAMREVVDSESIEVVFNLAVVPLPTSLRFPEWTIRSNIDIAVAFCELARGKRIQTLVHCSSSEAYGSAIYSTMDEAHPLAPTTPYAASKAASDQIVLSYCQTFGIDAAIVRPFNNFGPRQNPGSYAGIIPIVVQKVRSGQPVQIHGDGLQTRDYVYVGSTVEAMVRICEAEQARGRVINVATGREITVNELVERLLRALGVPDHPVTHGAPRPGDVRRHRGDTTLLRSLTGFEPGAISDEDLRETVSWYRRD
jgi:UDP-glucose 4-epimerase